MVSLEINGTRYGCRIHQRDKNIPWLLMLHGFMGDHRVFEHLVDRAQTFCNPITPDLLGFGESGKPANPERYREDQQLEDIQQLVKILDTTPLFLYGYSMGGRLALKIALKNPTLFQGVILESTTCGIIEPTKRRERRKTDARRASQIRQNYRNFLSRWQNLKLFQSPLPVDNELEKKYRHIQLQQAPPALANSLAGFGTGTMSPACDELKQLSLPVLLLAGSADEKYQQVNNYMVKELPNATFSSIEAGHRVHLDNPDKFLAEIKTFIDLNN